MAFHSLQATSQALQPMQIEVSVKKPLRGGRFRPARVAGDRVDADPDRDAHDVLLLDVGVRST